MNILDNEELEQESIQKTPTNKGPFIGLIIAAIGLILLISSIFLKSSVSAEIAGEVSYASKQKVSGEVRYQDLKIKYTYNGKNYETAIKAQNGNYSKYDTVTVKIINNNPTNISISKVSSGKGGIIFSGFLFLIIGVLLFLNIIPYQQLEEKIKNLLANLSNINGEHEKTSSSSGMLSGGMMAGMSELLDKLPKKDRDNTKDDMEERISKRKSKTESKNKNNNIYMSDNILDLYEDDENNEDDE